MSRQQLPRRIVILREAEDLCILSAASRLPEVESSFAANNAAQNDKAC